MKRLSLNLLVAAAAMLPPAARAAGVADQWPVLPPDAGARAGAEMPYTRYDTEQARMGGGAAMIVSPDVDPYNIASQGSNRNYISLPSAGAYAEWTVATPGDGVTVRFTLADSADGMGIDSNLDVWVNGAKVKTVPVSSYNMWQYFGFGSGHPSDTPGGVGSFAFDETHFRLDTPLKSGDVIRIASTGGDGCGIDFIELEEVPDPIEPDGDYIDITEYGAGQGGDDVSAFVRALAAADNGPKCLYLPEGNYRFNSIVDVRCEGVKIMGTGIWHTNILFTSAEKQSGGFSGGNGYSAPGNDKIDDYCTNVEFCHMYINSRLRSRYGEQAVYKCFMDVWRGGSVIHDIWQEHFECGFWIGDYNGVHRNSSGVKIINCRIRNNFADGVNFCQSTSHSYVFNCNIRNCGDDGLAVWNATDQSAGEGMYDNDEIADVFAYNTIDFVWRAGGIAIYGGDEHLIYNNYVRDMFMAAGIHVNDRYPGPKFQNTNKGIVFENNVLVGCGTDHDCWNEDFAAVDIIGNVRNVTFKNTQIYDSPFYAIRVQQAVENIRFDDTQILGSGLAGGIVDWSCSKHSPAAIRLMSPATFNNVTIGNVREPEVGRNDTWPVYTDNNAELATLVTGAQGYTFIPADETLYEVPDYPTAKGNGGGLVDPWTGVENYNLALTGLAWRNQDGSQTLREGDRVEFLAEITNTSDVDIPQGAPFALRIRIDDKNSFTINSYKDGLKAGQKVVLVPNAKWTASAGAHTAVAVIDPAGKLTGETSRADNDRTKNFNVYETDKSSEPVLDRVSGGYDLAVVAVGYRNNAGVVNGPVEVGEPVVFFAKVANLGDRDIAAGQKIGVQWQVDGKSYGTGRIWWNDQYFDGVAAGQIIEMEVTGTGGSAYSGPASDITYIAEAGSHTLKAWVDDQNVIQNEIDDDGGRENAACNNTMTVSVEFPKRTVVYFDNPDSPDKVDETITEPEKPEIPSDPMAGVTGYNLQLYGLRWDKGAEAAVKAVSAAMSDHTAPELKHGDAVKFSIRIDNTSTVDIPAGVDIKSRLTVDNSKVIYFPDITDGLKAGEGRILTTDADWTATGGAHTAVAHVDYNGRFLADTDPADNQRVKNFNVTASGESYVEPELTWTPVSGGSDLQVLDIRWQREGIDATPGHGPIAAGDRIRWTAEIVNAGDQFTGSHKVGVQFQINNGTDVITWCDALTTGLQPQTRASLTANGGTAGPLWTAPATAQTVNVTAWVNDTRETTNEVASGASDAANKLTRAIAIPYAGVNPEVTYHPTPDMPDVLAADVTAIETIEETDATEIAADAEWFDLHGRRLAGRPAAPGIYIADGRKVVVR